MRLQLAFTKQAISTENARRAHLVTVDMDDYLMVEAHSFGSVSTCLGHGCKCNSDCGNGIDCAAMGKPCCE
jgi:hypothetical protein